MKTENENKLRADREKCVKNVLKALDELYETIPGTAITLLTTTLVEEDSAGYHAMRSLARYIGNTNLHEKLRHMMTGIVAEMTVEELDIFYNIAQLMFPEAMAYPDGRGEGVQRFSGTYTENENDTEH